MLILLKAKMKKEAAVLTGKVKQKQGEGTEEDERESRQREGKKGRL